MTSGQSYVALLRGINVSGRNPVSMKDLRTLVATSGAEDVESYLQSGNVVFRSSVPDPGRVRAAIESRVRSQLGIEVVVVIRTASDLHRIMESNPLLTDDRERASLHVTFLAAEPDSSRVTALLEGVDPESPDDFRIGRCEVYLSCPNGYGRTKLTNAFFERKLAVAATTRNWRTVTALAAMAQV